MCVRDVHTACVCVFGLDQLVPAPWPLLFFLAYAGQTKCELWPSTELREGLWDWLEVDVVSLQAGSAALVMRRSHPASLPLRGIPELLGCVLTILGRAPVAQC